MDLQLIQQPPDGSAKPVQVFGLGKPVVAVLDEQRFNVLGTEPFGDLQARLPRHVLVVGSVDQPDRAIERDFTAQKKMVTSFVEKLLGNLVRLAVVTVGDDGKALRLQLFLLFGRKVTGDQVFGEIRRRGGADKPRHSLGPGQGRKQHDPSSHGRSDQNLRSFSQLVQGRHRVPGPLPDGAVFEGARGFAVAGIIEPEVSLAAFFAEFFQRQRLAAGHVGLEPGHEDDPGGFPRGLVVGDGCAVVPC